MRIVWRYQKGNQNPYIKEEQTTQWPKEKVQKDKQWSTKHTHKTKDRVTLTPLKAGVNSGAPEESEVPAPLVASVVLF
jgi:LysM repeat protein